MNQGSLKQSILTVAIMASLALAATACGKAGSTQTTSNIGVSSPAFSAAAAMVDTSAMLLPTNPGSVALTAVTGFSFCVKRVRLDGADGNPVKKEGETGPSGEASPDDMSFAPGLIDVSNGVAKSWGTMNVPVGFKLSRIRIRIKADQTLCGVPYSVSFDTVSTTEDVEFKWKFNPAIDLSANTTALSLPLDQVVAALQAAANAGTLSSGLKAAAEGAEGSGQDDSANHPK